VPGGPATGDPAEDVALVIAARRGLLLHAHRHRLRREDLEDCYSQASLELVVQARTGRVFHSRRHVENAVEQRFLSRIQDRRRALGGRSPMQAAFERASPIGEQHLEIADARSEPEQLVMLRQQLRRLEQLARELTDDQRLVIAWQLGENGRAEFCERFGWSPEKYRKVAQRARARLRELMTLDEAGVPGSSRGRR
jgi:DNA-directed RNA polymerase specialized sigma24 family protein